MLFEINKKKAEPHTLIAMKNSHQASFISSQDDYLRKHLHDIDVAGNQAFHFTSNGRFALHDLIIYFTNRINQGNVICESFNISTSAARKLVRAWDSGLFLSLKLILNSQKKHNFMKAVRLMEGKFSMHFMKNHAKCAVIWNEKFHITIITSGNLSSNQNHERGVIFFDKTTFDFDFKRMNDVFGN